MERQNQSPTNYSHERVAPHVIQLQPEGRLPGEGGAGQPVQSNPSEGQAGVGALGKPLPQEAESTVPNADQEQAEPQKPKRKRTITLPYARRNSPTAYLDKLFRTNLNQGLSEEQIRLGNEFVDEKFRMWQAGATPGELRQLKDEFLVKKWPGLSVEEAREKNIEHTRNLVENNEG